MDSKDINRYPIREYLAEMNIYPAKERGYYGMYHSPFREDSNASMKVDYNKNLWIDYGSNEGGTLIDLAMRMENCTNGRAMQLLEQQLSNVSSFSFHRNNTPIDRKEKEPAIQINDVRSISHPALLQYLKERWLSPELTNRYCKEVHYSINGKLYFAVGFQNNNEGWVLRNGMFKGCTSMDVKTYFHTEHNKETCLVFEGFADFLSYLVLKGEKVPQFDTIVLNSTVNLPKVKNKLSEYQSVQAFLDNDEGGKRAVQSLRPVCKEVIDQSIHYAGHKDLNDYLCNCSVPKQAVKKIPGRGLKM
jgi:hypothetical protein